MENMIKNREESLIDQELLFDYSENAMVLLNINGKILAANSKFANIYKKNKNDLIGEEIFNFIEKKFLKIIEEAKNNILKTKKPFKITNFFDNKYILTELKPIFNKQNKIVKIALYIRDVTDETLDKLKLETILDQSLMAIVIIIGNKIAYVNNTAKKISGYSKKEFNEGGMKFLSKIIHPEDRDFVITQLNKKLRGDEDIIERYNFRLISKSGEIKWLELNSKVIKLQGKNADLINIIDKSKEKKIEEDLLESENKWNSLVENLPENDRIIIIDKNYKIVYVNRTYPGYNKNIIGDKYYNFIHEDSVEQMKFNINKVFTKGISTKFETSIISPYGERKFFHSIAAPLKKDNKIIAALCIAIDTTKLKTIESDLKLNLYYIQKILDSTSEIIFTINKNKQIVIWNKSAEEKTGYNSKNILNKKIRNIKLFENPYLIEKYIEDKINRKKSDLKEIMINTKKGNKLLLGISSSEIKDELNEVSDIIFVAWDITHENISESLIIGKSYIIFENKLDNSLKIFDQNVKKFKKGIIITRNVNNLIYEYKKEKNIELIELSLKQNKKIKNISNFEELKKLIKLNFNNNQNLIILLDRIDYFLSRIPFTNLIKDLYDINDILKNFNSTIIIRFNSSLITPNQRIQLEQEFNKIPKKIIEDIKIKDEIYYILKYINKKNENHLLVTNKDIEKQFNIAKKSLENKLDMMLEKGLIYYTQKGKIKKINISNKGIKYL